MKKESAKLLLLQFVLAIVAVIYCVHISSCNNASPKQSNESATAAQAAQNVNPIKNDKLFPFLFGGIYFLHGYGGAASTFDRMESEIKTDTGSAKFQQEMSEAYSEILVYPYKKDQMSDMKEGLADAWDIHNKKEMLETLDWLLKNGHQEKYSKCKKAIDENGGANADLQKIDLAKYDLGKDDRDKLAFVKKNLNAFSAAGIKSWDYARYVNNICMGYSAGYLSESEGNELLQKVVVAAQKDYENWKAYFTDFKLGRSFWNGDDSDSEFIEDVEDISNNNAYNIYKYMHLK